METVMVTSAYPGQERLCQIHEVNVRLLFEENESFNCGDIQVAEGHVERHGIRAILGRDVLSRLRFIYDGPGGTYTLEY